MNNVLTGACYAVLFVGFIVVWFILGVICGEVIVYACNKVGYAIDEVVVRSVWICLWMGVNILLGGKKSE